MGSSPIRVAIQQKQQPLLYASVAQLVEQGTENPRVVGSIPTGGTNNADLAHLVERDLAKVEVAGSIPVIRSRKKEGTKGRAQIFLARIKKRDLLVDIRRALVASTIDGAVAKR